jgi:hypothetical protein
MRVPASALDGLRRDPGRGRSVLLRTIGIAVAVITVATVILTVLALSSSASTADKLEAAGDVLVGATLLLAAIAAVVALLAYAVSTFNFSYPNNPVFKANREESGRLNAEEFKQLTGNIQIRNKSSYSAKNPAVIIRLRLMAFVRKGHDGNWPVIDFANMNGITAVQWDGGPTYSIHGNSTRRLPDLQLDKLRAYPASPALVIELLADGYRKEIILPVDFTVDGRSQFPRGAGGINPEWM